jgi:hypothetical protein
MVTLLAVLMRPVATLRLGMVRLRFGRGFTLLSAWNSGTSKMGDAPRYISVEKYEQVWPKARQAPQDLSN